MAIRHQQTIILSLMFATNNYFKIKKLNLFHKFQFIFSRREIKLCISFLFDFYVYCESRDMPGLWSVERFCVNEPFENQMTLDDSSSN